MQLKRGCSGVWIAALVAVADQITKAAVRVANSRRVLGPIAITPTANTGAAFSMFSGNGLALAVVTALLTAGIVGWLIARPQAQSKLLRAALWMIVGGGLGNLYDRIVYGHVTDFIELLFVNFAVFNLADAFICVGTFLAAVALIRDDRKKEPEHA